MKKHLFSLLMAFALVVGLSVSAWSQATLPATPASGAPTNPRVYLTGATDSLQVVKGVATSTLAWKLYKGTSNTDPLATAADLDLGGVRANWDAEQDNAAGDPARFRFKWTDAASGQYYLQVTETDQRAGRTCAQTVRGFHIYIMGFDVSIYASNITGDSLKASVAAELDMLQACGGATYPAFLNDPIMNVNGTIRTDIVNTVDDPATNSATGDLKPIIGEIMPRAVRYYTAAIHFDAPPTGVTTYTNPPVASVSMDIKINVPTINSEDSLYVASINGVAIPGDKASILQTAVNLTTSTTYLYTFPVTFNDSWGDDLVPTASIQNVMLWSEALAGGINRGEEPALYEDLVPVPGYDGTNSNRYDNTSNAFTIYGKPATGPVIVH